MTIKKKSSLIFFGLMLLTTGCHKEEIPIHKRPPGDFIANSVGIGEYYENQLYFDLESNSVISTNLKTVWDLAFESSKDGWHVILNSGRGMAIAKSELSFDDLNSTSDAIWNWDVPSGNLDSNAIGDWRDNSQVYIIDLGYDQDANHLGYKKIQFTHVTETDFTFVEGDLTDETGTTSHLAKNQLNLFTYYKFSTGAVEIAPPNADYDLVFTQYTHVFHEPLTPYLVTGVLLNRYFTSAKTYDNKPFEQIAREDIEGLEFSTELDAIGYDWKFYNFEEGMYEVDPTKVYIIKTNAGFFYKFRFTGFYNELGIKGFPSFEFQLL
jgi:hypothetical protein